MGLSETRKILSVIVSVITAFASAAIIVSILINSMITSEPFLEKVIVTDEMVAQCDEQLSAKYKTLRLETGIPERVFEQVKNDYDIRSSLVRALQNVFNAEDATLYNKSFVDYFDTLCTEFLKDSEMKYNKNDVRQTAEKAARIFCDTVGFHNVGASEQRIKSMKDTCAKIGLVAVFVLILGMLLIALIYTEKQKGFLYSLAGITAGSFGTFIASVFCFIGRVWSKINMTPAVFDDAVSNMTRLYLLALILVSVAIAVLSYIVLLLLYRKAQKKEQRVIVV